MAELPAALELHLSKLKPLAPPFHQHIARSRLLGQAVTSGDEIVVYRIEATVPTGPVVVTEETVLRFE